MPGVTWRRARAPVLVLGLSLAHAVLVGMLGAIESPNADEIGHLAAGISIWELGRCDRYCVNPPLCAPWLPFRFLLADPPRVGETNRERALTGRSGVSVSSSLNATDGSVHRGISPLLVGRVFRSVSWVVGCATGGLAIFTVARSGVLAIVMFYASPNVIAWGATICPDVPAAATGVSAAYVFWRWLAKPAWTAALRPV